MPHNLYGGRSKGKELTAQERAAMVTYDIIMGRQLTTLEIARRIGITNMGAWKLMQRVSRVVPVYQDEGRWRILD